jgi:hypothetical protein
MCGGRFFLDATKDNTKRKVQAKEGSIRGFLPSLGFVNGTIIQHYREEHAYKKNSTKQGGIHGCS